MKQIRQGDIFLANLNPVKGHEQAGLRPVLVLQNNILNHNLNTVVIAPLTSNLDAKGLMTTHFLPRKKTKLPKDSVALLYQVRTIDKRRLIRFVGKLDKDEFHDVRFKLSQIFW